MNQLVVGNWKMNGNGAQNETLLNALSEASSSFKRMAAVCVPFPYLAQTAVALQDTEVLWGAQDVSEQKNGAFTGQVSASMLREFDCHFVIVGHSERRQYQGESCELVALKARAALSVGICPIVCVGESLEAFEAGQTLSVIDAQLQPVVELLGHEAPVVIAYEPVWAIGTGKTATPEQAEAVHAHIAKTFSTHPILYGGSVKPDNAAELFAQPHISGALVGGASLKANDFINIINA